ncbi:hypothetical protein SSP24_82990 [Streptomyces spinoverrucosus]|uniref:Uncharacterized protein n=1 Tax=Streptomyces spinoverrucosus TaxID=284043 RepID=A0A4Y3VUJ9_9ACTN|nr:fibronectin type III domain-containing protein [Streptomyces spinoverrucosus]GEC10644.1 hypothetical protein SSP24_82990 [Streptomyces spinoverrucosus]GHB63919.1 hypothetical protein GCM10010397_37520 [Streptomyces spinoverrucosus]
MDLTYSADRIPRRPVALFLALAGVAGALLVGSGGLDTVVGCGSADDPYPSQTAQDWVENADHVVVATPVREEETNRREFKKGAYRFQTDRTVTLRTDDVLWSAPRPDRSIDEGFELTAPGWRIHRASGNRVKRTAAYAPRLEPGHTYLLAVRWTADGWAVLGEGAAVPFDDRTAGRGEWCGRVLTEEDVARGERFSRRADDSLEKAVNGRDEQAVVAGLEGAGRS